MSVVKIWLISFILIIVTYTLHHFHSVFGLFFIAMAAAYILNPAVQFFSEEDPEPFIPGRGDQAGLSWIRGFHCVAVCFCDFNFMFGFLARSRGLSAGGAFRGFTPNSGGFSEYAR